MSDRSTIEWTDATWNVSRGCTRVSAGCARCYAATFAARFKGVVGHPYERGFEFRLVPEALELPLRWRRPRLIFVDSMSDLFHEEMPDAYLERVFEIMRSTPRHRYQVVTKRAERLLDFTRSRPVPDNVWVGVTVEDAANARRVQILRRVDAKVRFLSIEPLLGPLPNLDLDGIHWVIVGGESGAAARPMDVAWARDLRDACLARDIPFFFKQWGARGLGRELDGRCWDEMPDVEAASAGARELLLESHLVSE